MSSFRLRVDDGACRVSHRRAADLLAEDFVAAGGLKLGELLGQFLAVGGDTRIAVNHGHILHQIFASGKGA